MPYPQYNPYGGWAQSQQPTSYGGWPTGGGGNSQGFYNPNSLYGAPKDYSTAPIVNGPSGYFADNPQAFYTRLTQPFAGGTTSFAKMVQNMYPQFLQGYRSAQATNPSLLIQDYANTLGPNFFQNQFMRMAPSLRGENPGLYGGGRMKWLMNR